jgi:tight adherence protein C
MLYVIAALAGGSVILLIYGVFSLVPARPRAISRRLAELEAGGARHYAIQRRLRQAKRERLEGLLEAFGEKVSAKRAEWSQVQQRLVQAGYRRTSAVAIYFALRLLAVAALGGSGLVFGALLGARPALVMLVTGGGALAGWIFPRYYILKRIKKRQKAITRALPDALDLMVVCVEAGLGLNQALIRVSEEMEHVSQTMSEELMLTNLEIRAGTPRDEALRNLGERTGVNDVKSLIAMLIQTDRFGTSIATALRVHSDTMRTKRRQRAEEAAAKTTIKLVFPLVLFIFPAMFVVILGPAVLHIIEQMKDVT